MADMTQTGAIPKTNALSGVDRQRTGTTVRLYPPPLN